jgi:hypothetical protein
MKNISSNDTNDVDQNNQKIIHISHQIFKRSPSLEGYIKVFEPKLLEKYDKKCRLIIKTKLGDCAIDNPNIYAEDLIVTNNDIPYEYIELQVYGQWKGKNDLYFTPFVFERKMKMSDLTLFICFSADYKRVVMFSKKTLTKLRYKILKYPYEMVHYVISGCAMFLNIDDLCVDVIKKYSGVYEYDDNDLVI